MHTYIPIFSQTQLHVTLSVSSVPQEGYCVAHDHRSPIILTL